MKENDFVFYSGTVMFPGVSEEFSKFLPKEDGAIIFRTQLFINKELENLYGARTIYIIIKKKLQ